MGNYIGSNRRKIGRVIKASMPPQNLPRPIQQTPQLNMRPKQNPFNRDSRIIEKKELKPGWTPRNPKRASLLAGKKIKR
ncbi:hypothetical protein H0N95_01465 [Candidatus Micrarchaeota archaeon]|nr:hypothetical protein [Candidatus Micrarchaeota archaeon]